MANHPTPSYRLPMGIWDVNKITSAFAICLTLTLVGCGDDDNTSCDEDPFQERCNGIEELAGELCNTLDECNLLEAGFCARDCTDAVNTCIGSEVSSIQEDWYVLTDDCLELNNCNVMWSCYYNNVGLCLSN